MYSGDAQDSKDTSKKGLIHLKNHDNNEQRHWQANVSVRKAHVSVTQWVNESVYHCVDEWACLHVCKSTRQWVSTAVSWPMSMSDFSFICESEWERLGVLPSHSASTWVAAWMFSALKRCNNWWKALALQTTKITNLHGKPNQNPQVTKSSSASKRKTLLSASLFCPFSWKPP